MPSISINALHIQPYHAKTMQRPPSPLSPHSNPTPHNPFFLSFSLAFAAFSLL